MRRTDTFPARVPQHLAQHTEHMARHTTEDVVFTSTAFADLVAFVGLQPPETGGLLLGSRDDYVVTKFIFDESGSRTRSSYDPDVAVLNEIVKREWRQNGLQLVGWAHSHPRGSARLSGDYGGGKGDLAYLTSIFRAMRKLPKFIVPIVFSSDDGPLTVHPYVAYRDTPADYRMGRLVVRTSALDAQAEDAPAPIVTPIAAAPPTKEPPPPPPAAAEPPVERFAISPHGWGGARLGPAGTAARFGSGDPPPQKP